MPILVVAIVAMLVQQTVATTAKVGLPAMFPEVAKDLGFDPNFVLVYTAANAALGILVTAGCGGAIRRWGALRVSQAGCGLMALGLAAAALLAQPWLVLPPLVLAVALNASGSTVATPASSQILAKYAPPKWAPLVFSIKQTGVPAGLAISGFVLAPLAVAYGWRVALLALAALCILIAAGLQPVREEFDRDRDPTARPRFADFPRTIRDVLAAREARAMALGAFCFVGMQSLYMNYTITYLHEAMDFDLEDAGAMFGAATLVAIPARIFWGWLGSTFVRPRHLLAALAVVMAFSTAAMGAYDKTWSDTAILAVATLVSATVVSWHGVLLSESARAAPPGEAGRMTGGVLAFGSAGQVVFPQMFGAGLALGGYQAAYIVIAIPAVLVAVYLLKTDRPET